MIYLRHAFAASGLAVPTTVEVVVDDLDWLVAQVGAEMQALFPEAQVHVDPAAAASETGHQPSPAGSGDHWQPPADLLVVVYPAGTQPEEHLARLGARARQARLGVALYCVDDRHFELVASDDLGRWEKQQRRRRVVLGWSRRAPAVWNRVVRRLVAP
jgi:hypothetical protein